MRTVLVTGAAGRIGSSLRSTLSPLGWTLRCTDRLAADGYFPNDDAEAYAAALPPPVAEAMGARVGGSFTGADFSIDEVAARS